MVLRLTSCSPRRPGFLDSVACRNFRRLDACVGASGPHDFTVRDPRTRQLRRPRPSLPALHVRDDRPNAPQRARGMAWNLAVIWGSDQHETPATKWHDGQITSRAKNRVK